MQIDHECLVSAIVLERELDEHNRINQEVVERTVDLIIAKDEGWDRRHGKQRNRHVSPNYVSNLSADLRLSQISSCPRCIARPIVNTINFSSKSDDF